jgi:hypothetical protein
MAQKKKRANTYMKAPDTAVISKIKSILEQRPSYGYRRITALLKADQKKNKERPWNHKKVYRVMQQENLLLTRPEHRPKKHMMEKQKLYLAILDDALIAFLCSVKMEKGFM